MCLGAPCRRLGGRFRIERDQRPRHYSTTSPVGSSSSSASTSAASWCPLAASRCSSARTPLVNRVLVTSLCLLPQLHQIGISHGGPPVRLSSPPDDTAARVGAVRAVLIEGCPRTPAWGAPAPQSVRDDGPDRQWRSPLPGQLREGSGRLPPRPSRGRPQGVRKPDGRRQSLGGSTARPTLQPLE